MALVATTMATSAEYRRGASGRLRGGAPLLKLPLLLQLFGPPAARGGTYDGFGHYGSSSSAVAHHAHQRGAELALGSQGWSSRISALIVPRGWPCSGALSEEISQLGIVLVSRGWVCIHDH